MYPSQQRTVNNKRKKHKKTKLALDNQQNPWYNNPHKQRKRIMLVTRPQYDYLIKYHSLWMKQNWINLKRSWSLAGVQISGNEELIDMVQIFLLTIEPQPFIMDYPVRYICQNSLWGQLNEKSSNK